MAKRGAPTTAAEQAERDAEAYRRVPLDDEEVALFDAAARAGIEALANDRKFADDVDWAALYPEVR